MTTPSSSTRFCSRRPTCSSNVSPAEISTARRVASDRLGLAQRLATVWPRRAPRRGTCWTTAEVKREQLDQVEAELAKGAEANGYPNDMWTLRRVAEVIERTTGVHYHPVRVWYILRHELGWSCQRPARPSAPTGHRQPLRHCYSR